MLMGIGESLTGMKHKASFWSDREVYPIWGDSCKASAHVKSHLILPPNICILSYLILIH